MKQLAFAVGALALSCGGATADSESSVNSAFVMCQVFDSTNLSSKPCNVDGWGSKVVATIDMTSSEARTLCPQVAQLMREKGARFDAGWTLEIRSPYSGENSIAFCKL